MSINSTPCTLDFPSSTKNLFLQREHRRLQCETGGSKVLVVGTTSDYVDLLRKSNPGRVLYLTDQSERDKAGESRPLEYEEIVCDLEEDVALILQKIRVHLDRWDISLEGVVSFDCESMELAALLARELSLSYPPPDSIRLCRDKFVTKTIWQAKGIPCPHHKLALSAEDVMDFWQEVGGPVVVKPLSGSGSELVFLCSSRKECERATHMILDGLAERKEMPLYSHATTSFVAEEFVAGNEFSCDFTIKRGRIEILRLTRKLKYTEKPFGTINGYIITDWQRAGINQEQLSLIFKLGAEALGLSDVICMVDFIVDHDKILLLEMTPRPGGDCIPFLLHKAAGFDVLSYFVEFAGNRTAASPVTCVSGKELVALRLHAERSGEVAKIKTDRLSLDPRTREINLVGEAGHRITMPPSDYDSWYLGYILFQPAPGLPVEQQCRELRCLLEVEMYNADN
ncbi:ATP-grasp domain-containing protein [Desulfogranum marinum]|uniref:ATP-grasp domain-containing protein n=1 Tax=Desulfogranum marinum TaxID=453220 RepID=UPI0019663EC7|nr:ATP-grasp domain-containing protein [Desulfogranum marinum]MBM9514197.1 ATP-grasp domain-containing protein [Desulfogranum marinum]